MEQLLADFLLQRISRAVTVDWVTFSRREAATRLLVSTTSRKVRSALRFMIRVYRTYRRNLFDFKIIVFLAAYPVPKRPSKGFHMEFNHFLSAYYPDTAYGGDRLYADMISQAKLVDQLGYRGVTIPEHHLINILLVPDPLQSRSKSRR